MHDGGVIVCQSVLAMLQQMAEGMLRAGRDLLPVSEPTVSACVGLWQAPGLFCSLSTCVHPPDVPPPQRYLILRAWPLVTYKDLLPGEPDVVPQVAIRIGLGEVDTAERYPEELKALGIAQEDMMPLEDQIAALESLKASATIPEQSQAAMEALEDAYERLRQLQQGAPP